MTAWVLVFIILAGGLFAIKICYVLCTAGALPVTKGALYVSTSSPRINALLDAIPMIPDETFYDLGCGDGRILRAVNRRYGVMAIGCEVNPLAFINARLRSLRYPNVRIKWGDFKNEDLGRANVVFCYLFPDVMKDVRKKLEAELSPGARVVSCNFPIPTWRPVQVIRPRPERHSDPIYIYNWPDACAAEKPTP